MTDSGGTQISLLWQKERGYRRMQALKLAVSLVLVRNNSHSGERSNSKWIQTISPVRVT
jgi:hypothetical protein